MKPPGTAGRIGVAGLAWREVKALWLALWRRDVPWTAKAVAVAVAAYALSPFDLSFDWIPLLGWIDDVTIVTAGIALAMRLIPGDVRDQLRGRAGGAKLQEPAK